MVYVPPLYSNKDAFNKIKKKGKENYEVFIKYHNKWSKHYRTLRAPLSRAKERFDFFYAMVDSVKIIDQDAKKEYVDYRWIERNIEV